LTIRRGRCPAWKNVTGLKIGHFDKIAQHIGVFVVSDGAQFTQHLPDIGDVLLCAGTLQLESGVGLFAIPAPLDLNRAATALAGAVKRSKIRIEHLS
jgi:hypothetical protein